MTDNFYDELTDEQRAAIQAFVRRVNVTAAQMASATNKVDGAHYAAMMKELNLMNHPQGVLAFGWQVMKDE